MGSTVSATESMSHIHSVDNMISDTTDQEANGKGQMTWTQFDEVDIEGKEYNNYDDRKSSLASFQPLIRPFRHCSPNEAVTARPKAKNKHAPSMSIKQSVSFPMALGSSTR